jgi:hypothetical protein
MPTEPRGHMPRSNLSEAPLSELFERAKRVADNSALLDERGALVVEFRRRDMSWRQIEEHTGWPHSNARRWLKRYVALNT